MFHCASCDEVFFSVEVLRYNTPNTTSIYPTIVRLDNVKYCPWCGGEVERDDYRKRPEKNRRGA